MRVSVVGVTTISISTPTNLRLLLKFLFSLEGLLATAKHHEVSFNWFQHVFDFNELHPQALANTVVNSNRKKIDQRPTCCKSPLDVGRRVRLL